MPKSGTDVSYGFPSGSDGKESACNVEDMGLIPGLGRSSGGGLNRWNTEDFGESKNIMYDTAMMDTCHYTFIHTHKMYRAS